MDEKPIKRLAVALEQEGIEYAFVGGLAVIVHGVQRATFDMDAVVEAEQASVLSFAKAHGYSVRKISEDLISIIDPENGMKADIMLSTGVPFYKQSLERAQPSADGLRFASVEDVILLKALAWRQKDIADVQGLVAEHADGLDMAHIWKWAMALEEDTGIPMTERLGQVLPDPAEKKDALEALAELDRMCAESTKTHGVYDGDQVAEARKEREEQLDDVLWKQWP